MSRAARAWAGFGGGAALVLGALVWLTGLVLGLERRELEARSEASRQESLRLALWRMDSALAPVIAREAARPYFHYAPFYSEKAAYSPAPVTKGQEGVLVPSPLLGEKLEFLRLHFQIDPRGQITSPQVPQGDLCDWALSNSVASAPEVAGARGLLEEASRLVTRDSLLAGLRSAALACGRAAAVRWELAGAPPQEAPWVEQAVKEFNVRQQSALRVRGSSPAGPSSSAAGPAVRKLPERSAVEQGGLVPLWRRPSGGGAPELLLVRLVRAGGQELVQGAWLDWPALERSLLAEVRDLLPAATLAPAQDLGTAPPGRLLASVPAVLDPGPAPAPALQAATPARLVLLLAWGALAAAAIAVGLVLRKALDLGERRGQFVSAVTHELRTPLTTFRLYSQMLADGMVREEEARGEYLTTLKNESERLSRVVENVLLYARVEESRTARERVRTGAAELVEEVAGRLAPHAERAGLRLELDVEAARGAAADVDPQAVEQILRNLVENAAKYAAGAPDPRIEVSARVRGKALEVRVRDHGPGIAPGEEARIFEAFRRGARDAHGSTPGIGLGLTLARGLARQLGGGLDLARAEGPGAAFVLTLPLA